MIPQIDGYLRWISLVLAAVLTLLPVLFAGFWPELAGRCFERLGWRRLTGLAGLLCGPYVLVAVPLGAFAWKWLAVYLLLPVAVLLALRWAAGMDPAQRGTAVDFAVLLGLGLAVDLRWLEPAWPAHMAVFGKMLLVDTGLLGFGGVRRLGGVGFDLRLRSEDVRTGLREFLMYAPAAVSIGLWLGFLHLHAGLPKLGAVIAAPLFTFFFIAVPEELFFRGWMQNLLERRMGRRGALALTALLFGLSHFNKRAAHFNWNYVVLAAAAGVFYGRAWRRHRRVGASAVTHTLVDAVWSLFLR